MSDSATPSPNDSQATFTHSVTDFPRTPPQHTGGAFVHRSSELLNSPIIGPTGSGKTLLRIAENGCADQASRMSTAMSPSLRDNFTTRISLAGRSSAAELMWNPPTADPAGSNEKRSR